MQIYFIIVRYYFMGAKNMNFRNIYGMTMKVIHIKKNKNIFHKEKWYRFSSRGKRLKKG